jgi:hypothetical protein
MLGLMFSERFVRMAILLSSFLLVLSRLMRCDLEVFRTVVAPCLGRLVGIAAASAPSFRSFEGEDKGAFGSSWAAFQRQVESI